MQKNAVDFESGKEEGSADMNLVKVVKIARRKTSNGWLAKLSVSWKEQTGSKFNPVGRALDLWWLWLYAWTNIVVLLLWWMIDLEFRLCIMTGSTLSLWGIVGGFLMGSLFCAILGILFDGYSKDVRRFIRVLTVLEGATNTPMEEWHDDDDIPKVAFNHLKCRASDVKLAEREE